jgi:sulfonate dioxygenase
MLHSLFISSSIQQHKSSNPQTDTQQQLSTQMAPSIAPSDNVVLSSTEKDSSLADRNTFATRVAGKGADPEKKALFASVTKRIDYTPKIGTELHGIKLTELTEQQAEELAAFIAERGVVFFRDQEDLDRKEHVKLGQRWGPLHVHPLVPHDQESPELIVLDSRLRYVALFISHLINYSPAST